MTEGNDPAFARPASNPMHDELPHSQEGLTKRELIAAMTLQGLLAGGQTLQMSPVKVAALALGYTDALIAGLNQ